MSRYVSLRPRRRRPSRWQVLLVVAGVAAATVRCAVEPQVPVAAVPATAAVFLLLATAAMGTPYAAGAKPVIGRSRT